MCTQARFNGLLPSKEPINCLTLNNGTCQAGPTLFNINYDEILLHLFTVSVDKTGGSYNTINDPYARVCVLNKVKNMDVKVFNLMSGINKTRFLVQSFSFHSIIRFYFYYKEYRSKQPFHAISIKVEKTRY